MRVDLVERHHHPIERDQVHLERHHQRDQQEEEQRVAAREPELRERVGGARVEHNVETHDRARDDHAVQEVPRERQEREDVAVTLEGPRVRDRFRRRGKDVRARLERGGERPVEGRDHEERRKDQCRVQDPSADGVLGLLPCDARDRGSRGRLVTRKGAGRVGHARPRSKMKICT